MTTDDDADEPTGAYGEETDRRRLLKWVAALAFGVPVVIEVITFGGLAVDALFGGDDGGAAGATRTPTPTAGRDAVGEGDGLLPAAAVSATVARSVVRGATDRTYLLRVQVDNSTDTPHELRLGTVTLYDGTTVAGESSTGTIPPGETGVVTGAWRLPNGEMPRRVAVTLLREDTETVAREVTVARPPIEG
ncbi:hypothetical protein [Halobaculum sp. MBLA0143]|uniref:hypothetical protein n=1 Tax=Halobaculum sp. MBLA0143 TaxID=3079933 RepID=UPI0035257DFA